MPAQDPKEYMRAYRARKKAAEAVSDTPGMPNRTASPPAEPAEALALRSAPTSATPDDTIDQDLKLAKTRRQPVDSLDEALMGSTVPKKGKAEAVAKRKWTNPYKDGLPDWPELIQGMKQKDIDRILDRINAKPKDRG